jgi:hypothetical protein
MWIKGVRDICAGGGILTFLLRRDRRTTAILHAIAILALYMAIVAAFPLGKNRFEPEALAIFVYPPPNLCEHAAIWEDLVVIPRLPGRVPERERSI